MSLLNINTANQPVEITSGISVSATANVSGQPVRISGNMVSISGQTSFEYGSSVLTADITRITSVSGGVFLGSGSIFSVSILNISGNNPMWVGGPDSPKAPFSGHGFILYGGAGIDLRVDAVEDIKIFAESSGQFVSWIGVVK